jgi:hypothetical protein
MISVLSKCDLRHRKWVVAISKTTSQGRTNSMVWLAMCETNQAYMRMVAEQVPLDRGCSEITQMVYDEMLSRRITLIRQSDESPPICRQRAGGCVNLTANWDSDRMPGTNSQISFTSQRLSMLSDR